MTHSAANVKRAGRKKQQIPAFSTESPGVLRAPNDLRGNPSDRSAESDESLER